MELLDEVLDAHGGRERWAAAKTIRARVRSGGLLLSTRVPGNRLSDAKIEVDVDRVHSAATPFPAPGKRAVFEDGSVRIETDEGETVESRADPRPCFFGRSGIRRNLRWDDLDTTYFAGYAWWNYLNAPYLLAREGMEVVEGEPWREGAETWRRLDVTFPPGLDTHSRQQTFLYDDELRLRRHDYVAEVVGGWAHAAHMCADHLSAGGLLFPTRRWVRPVGPRNRPLPFPTLIWLELSEVEVESRAA
jgi:hypothetical protein